ncbi:VOC family protein [Thalassococcus sp. S3]|uniref:VOC family protein n=1 Tax=Thalassococcus sp. S3 TaxID=2017482 RepID=UPI0010241BD0|nr:VOC family protein [Thalassococcus sp. S3]QBF32094.1 glyoxalase [Thalassococcus sp. S3]
MAVRRIVANIAAPDPSVAASFYTDCLGLEIGMDLGWILTVSQPAAEQPIQLSFAQHGGSGTQVPDLSIEVDDLDGVRDKLVAAGFTPTYGPVDEPWGVRRFYVQDPFGRCINILEHAG